MESLVNAAAVPDGYVEHAPPADLATAVMCAWTRRVSSPVDVALHRVLPDGCTDILFTFGKPGAHDRDLVGASVVGAMTRPIVVQGPHPWLYVGVRLAPGFAQAVFRVPASELTDQTVDYHLLDRDAFAHVEILAAATEAECVPAAFDIVRRRLARGVAVSRSVRAAVRRIVQADGSSRSPRSLARSA